VKRLVALILVTELVASGGCIFSSDDGGAPPAVPGGWQPEFRVTPDSVSVFFPNDWPDTTTFEWNRWAEGVPDYTMDAVVRIATVPPVDAHIQFIRRSDGGPRQRGTFAEMAKDAIGSFWTSYPATGIRIGRSWPFNEIHVLPGGVLMRAWRPAADFIYAYPPIAPQFWSAHFERHGLFVARTASTPVHYRRDVSQLETRKVTGALDDDDYVVMDLVLKTFLRRGWPTTVVASSTRPVPRVPPQYHFPDYVGRDIDVMQPDHDTRAAFEVARLKTLDTTGLAQVGYTVAVPDDPPLPDIMYVWLSAVAYNHARTEAVLYASSYCGNLCGEGLVYRFEKVDGYWVMKDWLLVWIS
jgi:hypothetical protein